MFFSSVKILHSLVKIKDKVSLLFVKILLKRYSLVKKNLKVFLYPLYFLKRICTL